MIWKLDGFGANAYKAARNSVNGALTGMDLILNGSNLVYVLCRSPGHHAERRVFGGFCYFNKAAIAAHHLSRKGTVALLDIDYHHGNGSQNLFYARKDVLFLSIHGFPLQAYPYFAEFADEKGEGEGRRFNFNCPLYPGADGVHYLAVLNRAIRKIQRFNPDNRVVSVGYDTMRDDPTGTFMLTPRGIGKIGQALATLARPTLLIQEGGYSLPNLRNGARHFLQGLTEV